MKRPANSLIFLVNLVFLMTSGVFWCSAQTFAPGEIINGGEFEGELKVFDADRDGDLDVIAFPYLYLNNGKGAKQRVIPIGNPKKAWEDCAAEDIDGDKDMDLVILYKSGEIDIYINDVKGFIKKVQKNKIDYSPSQYAKLFLYDANSDRIRDIIILSVQGPPIAYVGDKSQQFSYFKQFNDQFPNLNKVLGLDINKDGLQELLVYKYARDRGGKATIQAYSFQKNNYVSIAEIALNTEGMKSMKLSDIDKDGDQDLVYSFGYPLSSIYWIERNNKGGFGKTNLLIAGLDMEDYQLGDFDSDGDLDVAYFTLKDQETSTNWAKNTGNNAFIKNHRSLLPNIKNSQKFVFEDFDGDKVKDVLFHYDDKERLSPRYQMILQDKKGLVKGQNTWMTSPRCAGLVFTDLDGNGTKDIIGYYNQELFYISRDIKGKYADPQQLAVSSFKITDLQCKDLNNDGKEDLVICSDDRKDGKVGFFKNEGDLKFKQFIVIHQEKERLINFEIVDYNKDGNKDLAVNYWKENLRGIYIYKNIGKGEYGKDRITVTEATKSFPRLDLWDVDKDGIEDIIDNGSNSWFKYEGNETWTKQLSPFKGDFIEGLYKANLDNNKVEGGILLSSEKLQSFKYITNREWQSKDIPVDFGIDRVAVGDINGDSFDDLVVLGNKYGMADGFQSEIAFSNKYSLSALVNDKSGNFTVKPLFPILNINSLVLNDIDNDGDLDIVTSSAFWGEGAITIWRNTRQK